MLRPIMLGGTGSDVGKSVLVAGLCRIFKQDGYSPAPFKAQNMALNSYVTPDGLEIGRAQAVQAEAAGVECRADMNPVLLKPSGHMQSQIVVLGKPSGNGYARNYYSDDARDDLRVIVHGAFDRLSLLYNPIVMEGAGSVAELNLIHRDIVNMPMAEYADAAVILVADIDRGGVFAQAYGSIMLQPEEYRRLIKGIIINKFRGDLELFREGKHMIEQLCGVPVIGVVPYLDDIDIEEEDSVALRNKHLYASSDNIVNVAVVALPHMSNFTDFDLLSRDPRVHLYFSSDKNELKKGDVIIIPGTKNTISDLECIKKSGTAEGIVDAVRTGKTVIGICGGYQIMGQTIADTEGIEGKPRIVDGLRILPVATQLTSKKRLTRTSVTLPDKEVELEGYEIHMGHTSLLSYAESAFIRCDDGVGEGCSLNKKIWGTYLHGILDNPDMVNDLIAPHAVRKGLPKNIVMESQRNFRQKQYDILAGHLRNYIDLQKLYKIMSYV